MKLNAENDGATSARGVLEIMRWKRCWITSSSSSSPFLFHLSNITSPIEFSATTATAAASVAMIQAHEYTNGWGRLGF